MAIKLHEALLQPNNMNKSLLEQRPRVPSFEKLVAIRAIELGLTDLGLDAKNLSLIADISEKILNDYCLINPKWESYDIKFQTVIAISNTYTAAGNLKDAERILYTPEFKNYLHAIPGHRHYFDQQIHMLISIANEYKKNDDLENFIRVINSIGNMTNKLSGNRADQFYRNEVISIEAKNKILERLISIYSKYADDYRKGGDLESWQKIMIAIKGIINKITLDWSRAPNEKAKRDATERMRSGLWRKIVDSHNSHPKAQEILSNMIENAEERSIFLMCLSERYRLDEIFKEAERVAHTSPNTYHKTSAFISIINHYKKIRDLENYSRLLTETEQTVGVYEDELIRAKGFSALAEVYRLNKDLDNHHRLLIEAGNAANRYEDNDYNNWPKASVFQDIITGFKCGADWEGAEKVTHISPNTQYKTSDFISIINHYKKIGDLENYKRLLTETEQIVGMYENELIKSHGLLALAYLYQTDKDLDNCYRLLIEAEKSTNRSEESSWEKNIRYAEIANAYITAEDHDNWRRLIVPIEREAYKEAVPRERRSIQREVLLKINKSYDTARSLTIAEEKRWRRLQKRLQKMPK